MQQYAITGDSEREGTSKRWLEWSEGESQGDGDAITGWIELKGRRIRMFSSDAGQRRLTSGGGCVGRWDQKAGHPACDQ